MKSKDKFAGSDNNPEKPNSSATGVKKKRKWVPEHKMFRGSASEGKGFAFQRKQKMQYEYKKLLRKEQKKKPASKPLYMEEQFPEHLRHLYEAEAEKLKKEAWTNRVNRSKNRMRGQETFGQNEEEDVQEAAEAPKVEGAGDEALAEDAANVKPESTASMKPESLPMSNRMKKKLEKKSSYQKTQEEFERVREKRRKKKEEYLKNKQQREEAIQRYKQKKSETYQMLCKKTKKGQPNLNLQMEYLLQKIQRTDK